MDIAPRRAAASEAARQWADAWKSLESVLSGGELMAAEKLVFLYLWIQLGGQPGYVDRFRTPDAAGYLGVHRSSAQKPFKNLVRLGFVEVIDERRLPKRGTDIEYRLYVPDPRSRGSPQRAKLDGQGDFFEGDGELENQDEQADAEALASEGIRCEGVASGRGRGEGGEASDGTPGASLSLHASGERLGGPNVHSAPLIPPAPQHSRNGFLCLQINPQEINYQEIKEEEARFTNGKAERSGGRNGDLAPLIETLRRRREEEQWREERLTPRSVAESILEPPAGSRQAARLSDDAATVEAIAGEILVGVNRWANPRDERTRYPPGPAHDVAEAVLDGELSLADVRKVLAAIAAARPKSAGAYADVSFGRLMARTSLPYRRFGKRTST